MNLPHDMGLPFQLPPGAVAGRPGKFISKTAAEKIGPHGKKNASSKCKRLPSALGGWLFIRNATKMKQKNLGRYCKEASNALNSTPSHAWIEDAEGIAASLSACPRTGCNFCWSTCGHTKDLLVTLRVPTILTDMLRRPASIQQLLAWSASGELPVTIGGLGQGWHLQ